MPLSGVLDLDGGQGVVDALADVGLLGRSAQGLPAGALGHPEHVDLAVVVAVFEFARDQRGVVEMIVVRRIGKAPGEFGAAGGEGVGDVFEKDQAEHEVLVFGRVHVGAQFVGRGPQGFLDVVEHAWRF